MDVSLTQTEGLPPKAYVSIRVGDTRRQAPAKCKEVFHFPTVAQRHFVVDIYEKLGSAQVNLLDLAESPMEIEESLTFPRPDGSSMSIGLGLKLTDPSATGTLKSKREPEHRHSAVSAIADKAKQYLETHGVNEFLRDMVHSLLTHQPKDAMAYMATYIEQRRGEKPLPAAVVKVTAKATEEGYPGFPVDRCPATLPDLRHHFNLMAEALKQDPAIYTSLKDLHTQSGVSFARVIKPGIDHHGHRLIRIAGCVAGDAECYDIFAPLFDKVIELRHSHVPGETPRPIDLGVLKMSTDYMDPSGQFVQSVQVRLSRNLAGFRFPPALRPEERGEVERVLVTALMELQGEYHPLKGSQSPFVQGWSSPAAQDVKELQSELFEEPDSALALSSGFGLHWPHARGIFAGSAPGTWAWVNEEDHLRLFVSEAGPNLASAYQKLLKEEETLSKGLQKQGAQFAKNARFGFLTSNPGNLGTALTASAHVRLPRLPHTADFRSLCNRLQLQASPNGKDVWVISNSLRLGSTAEQQIATVLQGVKELIGREIQLAFDESFETEAIEAQTEPAPAVEPVSPVSPTAFIGFKAAAAPRQLDDSYPPGFPTDKCPADLPDLGNHHSLLAEVLKLHPDVYHSLKDKVTAGGVSFAKVIKQGIDKKGHPMVKMVGAVAGDAESYRTFAALFDKISELKHGFTSKMRQRTDLDPMKLESPHIDPSGKYVASVKLSVARNLDGFCLPSASSVDERRGVEQVAVEALLQLSGLLEGEYFPLAGSERHFPRPGGMTMEEELYLNEAGVLLHEPDSALLAAAGLTRAWPDARGVFANTPLDLFAWINEEDHVKLFATARGDALAEAFERLCRAEQSVAESVKQQGHAFIQDDRLGFVTSCPSDLGPALHVSVALKLPLLGARSELKEICHALWLGVRRDGDQLLLSNTTGLGASEVEIVNSMAASCRVLVSLEKALESQQAIVKPGLGSEALPVLSAAAPPGHLPSPAAVVGNQVAETLLASPVFQKALAKTSASGIHGQQLVKATFGLPPVHLRGISGLIAGDASCYEVFPEIYQLALPAIHHGPKEHPSPLLEAPAVNFPEGHPAVLSVRLQLTRNLEGLAFTPCCSFEERREVERVLSESLLSLAGPLEGEYLPLPNSSSYTSQPGGMSAEQEKQLRQEGLLFGEPKSVPLLALGVGRHWPDARGVFVSESRSLAAWVNEEEHVSLLATRSDGNLHEAAATLFSAERALGMALEQHGHRYAHSSRFGFLTALPERTGAALTVKVSLRLPKLFARGLPSLCEELGLKVCSFARGGVVEVSNKATFGVSEAAILTSVSEACQRLISLEEQ